MSILHSTTVLIMFTAIDRVLHTNRSYCIVFSCYECRYIYEYIDRYTLQISINICKFTTKALPIKFIHIIVLYEKLNLHLLNHLHSTRLPLLIATLPPNKTDPPSTLDHPPQLIRLSDGAFLPVHKSEIDRLEREPGRLGKEEVDHGHEGEVEDGEDDVCPPADVGDGRGHELDHHEGREPQAGGCQAGAFDAVREGEDFRAVALDSSQSDQIRSNQIRLIRIRFSTHPYPTHKPPGIETLIDEQHGCSHDTGRLGIDGQHGGHDGHDDRHPNGRHHEGSPSPDLLNRVPRPERGDQEPDLQEAGHEEGQLVGESDGVFEAIHEHQEKSR